MRKQMLECRSKSTEDLGGKLKSQEGLIGRVFDVS
jgi:hypothetical protein